MSDSTTGRPSTPSLFAEALTQMTTLFETEIRLVRTEINEKISQAVTAIAVLVVSAVLLVAALIFILQGVVAVLIAAGLAPYWADFLVGIVIAIIGGIAVYFALNRLSASNLAPNRSIHQFSKDAQVIKEQVR